MSGVRPEYQPTAEEIALQAWVLSAMSGYNTSSHTVQVIYENQNARRPPIPYASLQVMSEAHASFGFSKVSDTPGTVDPQKFIASTQRHYRGSVSVNIFGPNHMAMAKTLVNSIDRWDIREAFLNARVWVTRPLGGPRNLTQLRDTAFEGRSQIDFEFVHGESDSYEAEAIESVSAELDVDGAVSYVDTR